MLTEAAFDVSGWGLPAECTRTAHTEKSCSGLVYLSQNLQTSVTRPALHAKQSHCTCNSCAAQTKFMCSTDKRQAEQQHSNTADTPPKHILMPYLLPQSAFPAVPSEAQTRKEYKKRGGTLVYMAKCTLQPRQRILMNRWVLLRCSQ